MGGDNTSVLIKGMEMPKNCSTCPCFQYNMFDDDIDGYCKTLKTKITDSDKHHPNCQLIEVPPHGELVDRGGLMDIYADRLTAVAERYSPDSSECGILSGAMKLLAIQPTVIEAEE